jgi:hypothetical protein
MPSTVSSSYKSVYINYDDQQNEISSNNILGTNKIGILFLRGEDRDTFSFWWPKDLQGSINSFKKEKVNFSFDSVNMYLTFRICQR